MKFANILPLTTKNNKSDLKTTNYKQGLLRTFIALTVLTGLAGTYFEGLHFVPLILSHGEKYSEELISKINNELQLKPECRTSEIHSLNNLSNTSVVNLVVIPDTLDNTLKVIDCPNILEFADLTVPVNPKEKPIKILKSGQLTSEFIKEQYSSAYSSAQLNRVLTRLKNGFQAIEYLWLAIGLLASLFFTIRWVQKGFRK